MTTPTSDERYAIAAERRDDLIASAIELRDAPSPTADFFRDQPHEIPGYGWESPYVDRFWIPTIGPTGVAVLRRLNADLDANGQGLVSYHLDDLAAFVGVQDRQKLRRTLKRLVEWNMLSRPYVATYGLRPWARPLFKSNVDRLPLALQREHEAYTARMDANDEADRGVE